MVGLHLAEGYTVPVGLGMCMLAALVITFLEPRVQHILRIRIDNDRRIYINDIPYYRIVLAASGVAIFSALVLLATGRFGSFVGDFLNVFRSFNR
jgi:hypothetical protein